MTTRLKLKMSSTDWVRLNVGGRRMETSRGTLTRCPDSALAKRFAVTDPEAMETVSMLNDNGDGIFLVHNIDCDPSCFQMILSWLR